MQREDNHENIYCHIHFPLRQLIVNCDESKNCKNVCRIKHQT